MQINFYGKISHKILTNIICNLMVVVLIVGLFAFFEPISVKAYTEKTGVVTVDTSLNVRSGPSTSYEKIDTLKNGYAVTIIGEEYASDGGLWYNIRFVNTSGATTEGYVFSTYITIKNTVVYEPDADFEKYLTAQGFPETYKPYLRTLHASYPEWVFVADKINLDWNNVIENESIFGMSLIAKTSISSWKSTENDAYNWYTNVWSGLDGGSWAAASKELVTYCMDPRNFLDSKYIFQFETLEYNSSYHTKTNLASMVKGSFLSTGTITDGDTGKSATYVDELIKIANLTGVSPLYLASSIILEMGSTGSSGSISGTYSYNGKSYSGLYNYYNWNAYANGEYSAIANGLEYAGYTDSSSFRPWNSRYKSLYGGAILFKNRYIDNGQDTAYYKKFNVKGSRPYTHQYMTHILAAYLEGGKVSAAYTEDFKESNSFVFNIPVYNNMPAEVSVKPVKDGSPNNVLSNIKLSTGSLTPTFQTSVKKGEEIRLEYSTIVENSVSSITITPEKVDSTATVTGGGKKTLKVGSNEFKIKVTAQNGDIRTYTVTIVRKASTVEETTTGSETTTSNTTTSNTTEKITTTTSSPEVTSTTVNIDDASKYLSNLGEGYTVDKLLNNILVKNGTVRVVDSDGKVKTGDTVTGDKVQILNNNGIIYKEYSIIIYGDVNGDGNMNLKDVILMRKYILKLTSLKGIYLKAGDTNRALDGVTLKDVILLRKQILGYTKINQK